MKLIILATFVACAFGAPHRMVLPRLPVSVILTGKFQFVPEDKIVGGAEVVPNSLPFVVSLQRKFLTLSTHACAGTILDEKTILTAAHCLDYDNATIFRVVAGEHSFLNESGMEHNSNVDSYLMHPDYSPITLENDIALIYLSGPLNVLPFNEAVQPINLALTGTADPEPGLSVTVAGWGTTSASGDRSDVLLSVDIPVVSDEDCNAAYSGEYNTDPVKPSMMCAGGAPGGLDACQGDSGGPLFVLPADGNVANVQQLGIVSWGRGCGLADYPGVYTQLSYYLEWINQNMVPA
ncbi:trypsin [Daphnia pulex]|uniref:Trypsin n=1 Tax=Daphnia pulex TaxID=6669 RepID=E9GTS5_DAPPU|nr:trypsin [Daphnia pulex]|eukprot:EFX77159.1 trypsin [Daphnia pulex]